MYFKYLNSELSTRRLCSFVLYNKRYFSPEEYNNTLAVYAVDGERIRKKKMSPIYISYYIVYRCTVIL